MANPFTNIVHPIYPHPIYPRQEQIVNIDNGFKNYGDGAEIAIAS